VAAMEAILRLMEFVHAPYYSLFIVGPAANLIEIAWQRRRRGRFAMAPAPSHPEPRSSLG
jgi:enediyne biosynthesis protein E5